MPERQLKEPVGTGVNVCFQCGDALALYRGFKTPSTQTRNLPSVGNRLVGSVIDPDGYRIGSSRARPRHQKKTQLEEKLGSPVTPTGHARIARLVAVMSALLQLQRPDPARPSFRIAGKSHTSAHSASLRALKRGIEMNESVRNRYAQALLIRRTESRRRVASVASFCGTGCRPHSWASSHRSNDPSAWEPTNEAPHAEQTACRSKRPSF